MPAKSSKRNLRSTVQDSGQEYSFKKKLKPVHDALSHDPQILPREGKRNEEANKTGQHQNSTSTSKGRASSLEFKTHAQDELKELFGQRPHRNAIEKFDSEESEESEEDGLSEEELKQTEGWKLIMEDIHSISGKPV